jgi:hypothetical protein
VKKIMSIRVEDTAKTTSVEDIKQEMNLPENILGQRVRSQFLSCPSVKLDRRSDARDRNQQSGAGEETRVEFFMPAQQR